MRYQYVLISSHTAPQNVITFVVPANIGTKLQWTENYPRISVANDPAEETDHPIQSHSRFAEKDW